MTPGDAGDIAWAPYRSTTFAAATDTGKVLVWDLAVDTHSPLCDQKVVKKASVTRITFSTKLPVLLAADSIGGVVSLKLSPNLRRITPIPVTVSRKVRPRMLHPPSCRICQISIWKCASC